MQLIELSLELKLEGYGRALWVAEDSQYYSYGIELPYLGFNALFMLWPLGVAILFLANDSCGCSGKA